MLSLLLRKKLEPGAEDWIYEHTTKRQIEQQANGTSKPDHGLKDNELRDLWSWASETSLDIVLPMSEDGGPMSDSYTIAEREAGVENVVTGLRRDLDRDSEEDDDEEDDDIDENGMEDIVPGGQSMENEEGIDPSLPPMPLENVLRFMTTGALPRPK
jgi:mediator of RNA polymerase II transcription subunit 8, fungi type